MKIGIIGAMEKEIFLIRKSLKNIKNINTYGLKACTGIINNFNLILVESGIGKTAAAISTTLLIYIYKPNILINIGSAARLINYLDIGDLVISNSVKYHDVNVTAFGYEIGQIPKCSISFLADKKLIMIVKNCIKELNYKLHLGLIISGDIFINNYKIVNKLKKKFPNAIAVDMESASIGHVCNKLNVPFIVIRMISDHADKVSNLVFKKNIMLSAEKSFLIIKKIINKLHFIYKKNFKY